MKDKRIQEKKEENEKRRKEQDPCVLPNTANKNNKE